MGNPMFQIGNVGSVGGPSLTDGFVLITEWMVGTAFHGGETQITVALTRSDFPQGTQTTDYQRWDFVLVLSLCFIHPIESDGMKTGCDAANEVGLLDCQGFL